MLVLRKILLCKFPYYILFIISIIFTIWMCCQAPTSVYQGKEGKITGQVIKLHFNGSKVRIMLRAKEKIIVTYRAKTEEELIVLRNNLTLGDIIQVNGSFQYPTSTQNFYSFSYRDYLKYQHIYYIVQADTIEKLETNHQFIYALKNKIRSHITNQGKASRYIDTFFLGDSSEVDPKIKLAFQRVGISHLFALSGTQISFITIILEKLLKRFHMTEVKRFICIQIVLCFFLLLIDSCAAIERAIVFSLIFGINRVFDFFIPPFSLILLSISILLFINPYYIFDIGFQYSTVIASGLLLYAPKLKKKNKMIELLDISWVSFLLSLPISLYHFSWINIMSILYNLFYVPLINLLIFPLSIITMIIPWLKDILILLTTFLENSVLFLEKIPIGTIVLKRIDLYWYILYYVFIIGYLFLSHRKAMLFCIIFFVSSHFVIPKFMMTNRLYMLDVGQGDSFLFVSNQKVMLVDTGGKMTYAKETWEKGINPLGGGHYIVQFLYQLGISKIHTAILTHGDSDHAGEMLTILEEIPVQQIYFNSNKINALEYNIQKLAKEKNIKNRKVKQDEMIFLGDFSFQVLSQNLIDENDSSTILLGNIYDQTILMMGDASHFSEQQLLTTYALPRIDILKVGHHGSKTSSGLSFLETIQPRIALISAGDHNRFGHPHKVVLKKLNKVGTTIYRTAQDGMVMFDFKNYYLMTSKGKRIVF